MIAIVTEHGTLRIAAEIPIPQGKNWGPGRITRLMAEIERYVFILELADKADNDAAKARLGNKVKRSAASRHYDREGAS